MDSTVLYAIVVVGLAILGALAKILWSGLQTTIVKAVLDSSLSTVLGGFKDSVKDIKDDLTGIRTDINYLRSSADSTSLRMNQHEQELATLRTRVDTSVTDNQAGQIAFLNFRQSMETFMGIVDTFMHGHQHGGPTTPESPK